MPSPDRLASLQALLGKAFFEPTKLEATHPLAAEVTSLVRGNERMTPLARAEIYREQFWQRHLESLREDHPGLAHLVGDEAASSFFRAYLRACPPRSYTLRDLGDRLLFFADGYDGFDANLWEPAREMLRFELACIEAFDAADLAPMGLEAALDVPPERWPEARLRFLRTLSVMSFEHPVNAVRAALKRGEAPPALVRRRVHVALWRCPTACEVRHRELPAGEHLLVTALLEGATLGEACVRALPAEPELGARVGEWLRGWARRGFIVGVELDRAGAD